MGGCLGKTAASSYPQPYTRPSEAAPARAVRPSSPSRNEGEGVLSGLPRRGSQAGASHSVRTGRSGNAVGFSATQVQQQTIHERGQSLRTSALDVCTGVAIGGVFRHSDGSAVESSLTVFHVLPDVRMPGVAIARQVKSLRETGFEVNAFVAGGDGTAQAGREQREALEAMLSDLGVPFGTGPLSDGHASQFLSASIEHNGEIEYRSHRGHGG
jgi:hypothetical protein